MLFRNEYAFLSNMYLLPDGKSVEHYFQALKCVNVEERNAVLASASPSDAKKQGRNVEIRSDWLKVREGFMLACLRYKFSTFPHLAEMLLATASVELVEENWWNDKYWGVCKNEGENVLGKLLMKVRDELKNG
jgi:ribA/ribD-fused uncharacterized protein